MGYHTQRLNATGRAKKIRTVDLQRRIAEAEAAGIAQLSGYHKLRVHVVGDCATVETAGIVGAAMVRHERRRRMAAWTYTHSWRVLPFTAWRGARVLASCDSVREIPKARARGYAVAVIVPPHPSERKYQIGTETIIPCPAQFRRPDGTRKSTCEQCTLCQRPELLQAKNWSVGFQPDANTAGRVLAMMKGIR